MVDKDKKQKLDISSSSAGVFYTTTVLCYIILSIFISIIVSILSKGENPDGLLWYQYLSVIAGGVMLCIALVVGMKVTGEDLKSCVGLKNVSPIFYVLSVLIFFGMVFGLGEANNYFIGFLQKLGYEPSTSTLPEKSVLSVITVTLFVCVAPALFEELIFRGVILAGLKKHGEVFAILISALLFSIYHMSPEKTVYQFLAGVLFGLIAIKSKSIIPSVIIHFLNNFFVVINYYFLNLSFVNTTKIILTVSGVLVLVGSVVFTCLIRKFEKGDKKGLGEFIIGALGGIFGACLLWVVALF